MGIITVTQCCSTAACSLASRVLSGQAQGKTGLSLWGPYAVGCDHDHELVIIMEWLPGRDDFEHAFRLRRRGVLLGVLLVLLGVLLRVVVAASFT